jgi:hypothetical protein
MKDEVNHPMLKLGSVVLAWAGAMSWGERASMMACIYTGCLIFEWIWKRIGKPLWQRLRGTPQPGAFLDSTGRGDL